MTSFSLVDGGFLVNLDSVAQRETFDIDREQAIDSLVSVLRMGSLLTGTLLLTDAQVLDGMLLQRVGPKGIIQRIGTGWEIYARRPTLDDALASFFDPGRMTLRYVELSSLDGYDHRQRCEVGKMISSYSSTEFRTSREKYGTVEALSSVLHKCGVDARNINNLGQYWTTWIDEESSGDIVIRDRPYGTLDMTAQAARKPLSAIIPDSMAVSRIMQEIEKSSSRSEIRAAILDLDLSETERILAREWFDAVYVCSIAKQYGTIAIELPRSSISSLANRRASDEATVHLSRNSIDRLSQIRIATFEVICDKAREDARMWRTTKKKRHIRHLATTVERDTASDSDTRRVRAKSAARLAFVAAVVQLTSSFEYSPVVDIGITLAAVMLTELVPVLYSNLNPKGRLAATVDPVD